MDHRIALKPDTVLCLLAGSGETFHCTVGKELGRGASCIVYEASRTAASGAKTLYRIKEFYPYKLSITRSGEGTLTPSADDAAEFSRMREHFQEEFSRANRLYYSDCNYAAMTGQLDVLGCNGTSYILSSYSSDKTLAQYRPQSLKECVELAAQTAYVLGNIHKQGYLYLDVKPDNVLVTEGYHRSIRIFDFDSLLPISCVGENAAEDNDDIRLSHSGGFAPIELQTARIRHIGLCTDVYGIGALLFYLIFGHAPSAPDGESGAEYDFSAMRYDHSKCDDRLFDALTGFFRKSLAVYYADRYQDMQAVLEQLERIRKYADQMLPRIFSSRIVRPAIFCGRDSEINELDCLLSDPDYNLVLITGMGGIGKSTFIREYLSRSRNRFDTILYIPYRGSIDATISNDSSIEINTLRQSETLCETSRYFDKKLQKLRELVRGTSAVLVIDNFTGDIDDDLRNLLSTDFKVVLLSRSDISCTSALRLHLGAISDGDALRQIFESRLGRPVKSDEQSSFKQILEHIDGHTLVLELIARQIAGSHISIGDASVLAKRYGFSSIAPEKIDYEKDCLTARDTIGSIIDAIFEAGALSPQKKILMKTASLLGDDGMDINQFQEILQLTSKDDINELIRDGWLMISADIVFMHHVIREAVRRWQWTGEQLSSARQLLTCFYTGIRREASGNNRPVSRRNAPGGARGSAGASFTANRSTDFEKLSTLLEQSESILDSCKREPAVKRLAIYTRLHCITVLNAPPYREEYILSEISDIFSDIADGAALNRTFGTSRDGAVDEYLAVAIMKLYARAVLIHADNRRFIKAEKLLAQARDVARSIDAYRTYALYYDMLSDYYDIRLDGFYYTDDPDEKVLLRRLLAAIDKTISYSRQRAALDEDHLYIKSLLAKATVLIRSGYGTDRKIRHLLDAASRMIGESISPYADVRLQYYLVCAWYLSLIRCDAKMTDRFIEKAVRLSEIILPTDMQKIENIIIPCANIYYELKTHDRAMALLFEGTRLCAGHCNTDVYARLKKDLCDHLWEVGIDGEKFSWCRKIIRIIDAEDEEIADPQNRVSISDEVRVIMESEAV